MKRWKLDGYCNRIALVTYKPSTFAGNRDRWFESWEGAHSALRERANEAVIEASCNLTKAKNNYSRVCKMEKP